MESDVCQPEWRFQPSSGGIRVSDPYQVCASFPFFGRQDKHLRPALVLNSQNAS